MNRVLIKVHDWLISSMLQDGSKNGMNYYTCAQTAIGEQARQTFSIHSIARLWVIGSGSCRTCTQWCIYICAQAKYAIYSTAAAIIT